VAIEMKTIEQYFPVVLFIMMFKVLLTLSLWLSATIQTKATENYFLGVRFVFSIFPKIKFS